MIVNYYLLNLFNKVKKPETGKYFIHPPGLERFDKLASS